MQIRISLSSDYDDREKGLDMPDIEMSKDFSGRVPTTEEVDSIINLFRRCLSDTPSKPKVRDLGSA